MPLHRAVGLEPRALPPSAAPPGVEPNDPAWEEREVTPAEQMHPADQDGMVDDYFDDGMGDGDPMEDIEAGGRDDTEDVVFANAGSFCVNDDSTCMLTRRTSQRIRTAGSFSGDSSTPGSIRGEPTAVGKGVSFRRRYRWLRPACAGSLTVLPHTSQQQTHSEHRGKRQRGVPR